MKHTNKPIFMLVAIATLFVLICLLSFGQIMQRIDKALEIESQKAASRSVEICGDMSIRSFEDKNSKSTEVNQTLYATCLQYMKDNIFN